LREAIIDMASQVTGAETRKNHRYAWLVAAAAVSAAQTFAPDLLRAGLHSPLVIALSFYVGVLGGLGWQRLNRVDLVDRFLGWALLSVVVMLFPLLALGNADFRGEDGAWSFPGVVVGVVLAERWMRQRRHP
jgi:hypothetical protein